MESFSKIATMKQCPKCNIAHKKKGPYCSLLCFNTRIRTLETRKKISEGLKKSQKAKMASIKRRGRTKTYAISKIPGTPYLGNVVIDPIQKQMDRKATAELYGFTVEEIAKAYLRWRDIFRIEGSNLLYSEYLDKLKEAKITPSQVGNKKNQYNLSRYNDIGSYTKENCRFITREENWNEYMAGGRQRVLTSLIN